jgi:tRNA A37 threonylcarbamoyladenosine modification protein TsaB
MIDARKNEVYAALYLPSPPGGGIGGPGSGSDHRRGLVEKLAPCVVSPQRLIESIERSKTLFIGSGALRYRVQVEREFGAAALFAEEGRDVPDTRFLCRLAERLTPIGAGEVVTLEPFYVRPDDATLKPLKGVCAYDRT